MIPQRAPRPQRHRRSYRPQIEALEDRCLLSNVNLRDFIQPDDIINAGILQASSRTQSVVLVNGDTTPASDALLAFDALSAKDIARYQNPLGFDGWTDPSDRSFLGDVDGSGVDKLIQFNRADAPGGSPTNGAIRIFNIQTGVTERVFSYSDPVGGSTYAMVLQGLVNPDDGVVVGHFTRLDHLEALFFNRTNPARGLIALRAIDLVTGQITFTSFHDGNIFSGWTDPGDDTFVMPETSGGYDDLVLVNRVPNPQAYEQTDIGFIGMVSFHDRPQPASPYLGFSRFFAWNYAGPDGQSVFPGYDDIGDHATAGVVTTNGRLTPVLVLVNSSSQDQAAYALLAPNPIVEGSPDSVRVISTIFHDSSNAGSFNPDNTYLMADINGDGNDAVLTYSRGSGGIFLRAFDSFSGARVANVLPTLDPSFGGTGVVQTSFGQANQVANGVAIQTDGKIVVAGGTTDVFSTNGLTPTSDFLLARYNPDGTLDTSFGSGGEVITSFGPGPDAAHALVIDPNGKIVVVGTANDDFAMARYNADGTLDANFGSGGLVTTHYSDHLLATSVTLQADGKIVVGGFTNTGGNDNFAVARYNPDGSLDSSFGGGLVTTDITANANDEAYAVAIQPDGKIVAVGFSVVGPTDAYAVVRYNTDGSLDSTFGHGGIVTTDYIPNGSDEGYTVALQPDGKILVGGGSFYAYDLFVLLRYNPDGSLDSSFGNGGVSATRVEAADCNIFHVALQSDGKIVAVGGAAIDDFNPPFTPEFGLARYNPDGSLDTSFGVGGLIVTNLAPGQNDLAFGAALQADGNIVAVGNINNGNGNDFVVTRFFAG